MDNTLDSRQLEGGPMRPDVHVTVNHNYYSWKSQGGKKLVGNCLQGQGTQR